MCCNHNSQGSADKQFSLSSLVTSRDLAVKLRPMLQSWTIISCRLFSATTVVTGSQYYHRGHRYSPQSSQGVSTTTVVTESLWVSDSMESERFYRCRPMLGSRLPFQDKMRRRCRLEKFQFRLKTKPGRNWLR